jgi:hypothetical protein
LRALVRRAWEAIVAVGCMWSDWLKQKRSRVDYMVNVTCRCLEPVG